jgi:AmmeMemoRadiSam system protein B/AmmeMemoRadiSam system protein A
LPKKVTDKEAKEPVKAVLCSSLAQLGWYTANADALNKQIGNFYGEAQAEPIEDVIALILPHAGYRWSGRTAVATLKTTTKEYKRIIVIGPSHRVPMEEILSVPAATDYETPLGQIPLDMEFISKLLKCPMFQNVPQAHKNEHSVQIELPLLQYRQKNFKLVPIVAGQCSFETIEKTGDILKKLVDEETLVIASSDFVHYGRSFQYVPFTENIPEQIKKLDMGAYKYIANLDARGFLEYKEKTKATICGSVPIAILLSMLNKPTKAQLVQYETSGKMTGNFSNSVSYLSIAFSGAWENSAEIKPQAENTELTDQDKEQLLILARKTIEYVTKVRRVVPKASELGVSVSDAMKRPRAAFVTLKINSHLRGCIGDIFPRQPLYKSVIMNSINACFHDPRFKEVTADECDNITIEISALTVPQSISSQDEIRIGVDGVILRKDFHSAVFLPQVAPEQGWDVDQTLTQLSLKAGLPGDGWKKGARFQVFQAEVFGEEEK